MSACLYNIDCSAMRPPALQSTGAQGRCYLAPASLWYARFRLTMRYWVGLSRVGLSARLGLSEPSKTLRVLELYAFVHFALLCWLGLAYPGLACRMLACPNILRVLELCSFVHFALLPSPSSPGKLKTWKISRFRFQILFCATKRAGLFFVLLCRR